MYNMPKIQYRISLNHNLRTYTISVYDRRKCIEKIQELSTGEEIQGEMDGR